MCWLNGKLIDAAVSSELLLRSWHNIYNVRNESSVCKMLQSFRLVSEILATRVLWRFKIQKKKTIRKIQDLAENAR
jgi:hypothetical protein